MSKKRKKRLNIIMTTLKTGIINLLNNLLMFVLESPELFWASCVNAFDFNGRANRREYINFYIVSTIVETILIFLSHKGIPYLNYICMLFNMVLFFPDISLTIRRLHDFNMSGWLFVFYLLTATIVLVTALIKYSATGSSEGTHPVIMILISLFWIVELSLVLIRGTKGSNRYGEKAFSLSDSKKQNKQSR